MTNTIALLLAMAMITLLVAHRIQYGPAKSQGSTKANTLYAIEQANSPLYRSMVLADAMIDVVLADILANPNDIINN